jgi:hypothetical protein
MKRFKVGEQRDPIQLLTWFLNTYSEHLHEVKPAGSKKNVIESTFQGTIEITSMTPKNKDPKALSNPENYEIATKAQKFFVLTVEPPTTPLFKEQHLLAQI